MIKNFEARPYLLKNSIQNYAWGTKGESAFIPKLVGIKAENDTAYAELWIGAHPKAPSDVIIDGESYALNELINQYPTEILGKYIIEKFGNKLPYLLKVLSINQALSIQVHPSKQLAEILNQKDPKNYPDDNHKPEIAVAIDHLQAIVGFKPVEEISDVFDSYPALVRLVGEDICLLLKKNAQNDDGELLKQIYSAVMCSSKEQLSSCISEIKLQIENKVDPTEEEKQFLLQYENYGVDAGLISILLFNMVRLNPGEAIFTKAGMPHAYIKGNIVECMANSDNVVRAGLTPKFKDVETLLNMLTYEGAEPEIICPEDKTVLPYNTPVEEFRLFKYNFPKEEIIEFADNNQILIGLILNGRVTIESQNSKYLELKRGESFLIPAFLKDFRINLANNSTFYLVKVPQK